MPTSRLLSVLLVIVLATAQGAESPPAIVALQAALAKNVAHAREWLEQKDYKSVAQAAGGLQLLAELTKAKSDDAAWHSALDNVLAKVIDLQSAARDQDPAKCKSAIDAIDSAVSQIARLQPTGQPQSLSKPPAVRALMLAMDAIQGDAKVALITGNVAAARHQAHVLAELAKLVSNSRATDQWKSLSSDFAAAANTAASSTESDPKLVRQKFRAIAERCEACHENIRMR
jgi:hypothetical protein